MTEIRFHPDARSELLDAATYYEEQADGLGGQFIDEAQRVADLLGESPGLGAPVSGHSDLRRWPLRRFPYYVIYRADADVLFILAVAHERRRPRYWSGRAE
ncbi:MAG: type II toxin-antitoxin system RelE/ParE family toxin [Bacteroidota bacterium]